MPGRPLHALAHVERSARRCRVRRRAAPPSCAHALHVAALLVAPARHPAGEEAGDVAHADRPRELGGAAAVVVVAADERSPAAPGSAIQASFVPNPARSIVTHSAPGTWASSNCTSVRTSTTSAPSSSRCSSWRGVSGCASTPSVTSGPRLSATMPGSSAAAGPSPAIACGDERVLVGDRAAAALWRELVADRRGDLHVHARPAAHRAAEVAGPDLGLGRQRQQPLVQRAEDVARALLLARRRGPGARRRRRTACRR